MARAGLSTASAGQGTGPTVSLDPEVTHINSPSRKMKELQLKNSSSSGDPRGATVESLGGLVVDGDHS